MIFQPAFLLLLPLVSASVLQPRSTQLCGQYQSVTSGSYTMFTNLWGKDSAKSSSSWQCSTLDSVNGNTVTWDTQYDWPWNDGIKSYSNIQLNNGIGRKLSAISDMQSTWHWSQDNAAVKANIAYDLFTSGSPGGTAVNEIMIWLANWNVGPLSYNYDANGAVPVASGISIGNYKWNLYKGTNKANVVFSFLLVSGTANSFSGDINAFLKYLTNNGHIDSSQYLTTAQAGTEATSGKAKLSTSAYSLTIN